MMLFEMTLFIEEDLVKLMLRTPFCTRQVSSWWESTFYVADGYITKDPSEAKQILGDSFDLDSLADALLKNQLPVGDANSMFKFTCLTDVRIYSDTEAHRHLAKTWHPLKSRYSQQQKARQFDLGEPTIFYSVICTDDDVLDAILNTGRAVVAAELLGAGAQAFSLTTDYLKER